MCVFVGYEMIKIQFYLFVQLLESCTWQVVVHAYICLKKLNATPHGKFLKKYKIFSPK